MSSAEGRPPPAATASRDGLLMAAALAFGRRNLGLCAPNPSVGALIVRDGALVGRGVTARGGRPHGERLAIAAAGPAAAGATLYVTLEPCCHEGGRAPPCAPAIVAAGITRVVSAMDDPDPRVAGRGHRLLREAGLEVIVGPGAEQARRDHLGHILRVTQGRPMVTLKLARTADGWAAAGNDEPRLAITGEAANLRVQAMRATHEAIMIGVETALADDPLLTVRLPGAAARPLRVVLDSRLRLPPRARLAATAGDFPTLAIATEAAPAARARALEAAGVEVERVAADRQGRVDLSAALQALARRGVTRLFSEGGPTVGAALIARRLADEVVLFTAPRPLGRPGRPALDAAALGALQDGARYAQAPAVRFGGDEMRRYERRE